MAKALNGGRSLAAALLMVVSVTLSGCAALVYGGFGTEGPGYSGPGPSKLRIAIYEPRRALLVPHAALVIHSPDEHLIYDPAGWTPDPRRHRRADVTYSVTPDVEQAFIFRTPQHGGSHGTGSRAQVESWELFLFEIEVSDAIAREAARIVRDRPALPMTGCAFGVSTVLRQLPGFENTPSCWMPVNLRKALEARGDLSLRRYLVPPAQGG